jgi:hypothetical protein
MAEGTYYVALPFVAADEGVASDEPVECFSAGAVVMRGRRDSNLRSHKAADFRPGDVPATPVAGCHSYPK